ncbi:MAG: outer membrane protein transport protein, partial [Polyangiaceae bacterium]|nr:outer membrane protein transport protein [Polyangiaceae bacterium]
MARPQWLRWGLPAALVLAASTPARADDGYFSGTQGARAEGRGGAFVAKADDLSAVALNPAGLSKVGTTFIEVGDRLSYNAYSYTRAPVPGSGTSPATTFARVQNQQPWQAADPIIGVGSNFGLRDFGFALAAYAPAGSSQESFPVDGGQRYMMVSRQALIVNYAASAAWKFHDVFGIGATALWVHVPRLDYSLVINGAPSTGQSSAVMSQFDMEATTSGSDPFTFEAVVGAWVRPIPSLELAVSGQVVPADIVTNSHLSIQPLGLAGNVTLSRDNALANDVTVTLPLPLIGRAGARYRQLSGDREVFDVEADVEYETWSRVKDFALDTHGLSARFASNTVSLGQIDIAKQWRDTVAVKLGGDVAVIPGLLTLRAGAYYETAVSSAAYQNVDFPGGVQVGGTVGGSVFLGRFEVAAAYEA